ncbi:MAG TPA: aminodeoxychorismate synthase component I [Pseudonocardiaceae bacterium]|jgi:para-aminobenzoate synthetase|nr:aminodeoxychorismate synthase component I [Pseudonocardiaceae bacterium]
MKVLLIDNFDSFTLNIAQYLYEVTGTWPTVVPNTVPIDGLPLDEVQAVVISPGPGRPSQAEDFGVCREVIARAGLPILGVCLGHQGIGEYFGARTVRAPEPAHGIVDTIKHTGTGLFDGLPQDLPVVRYHSLVLVDLPDELEVTAWTGDGLVMAFAHRDRPLWGVQFHPESIDTQGGHTVLTNFVRLAANWHAGGTDAATDQDLSDSPAVTAFRKVGGVGQLRLHASLVETPMPPEELFESRYANRPNVFWLDSEHSDRPGARYSIMGAATGPGSVVLRYHLATRSLTLDGDRCREEVSGDLFTLLGEILSSVEVEARPDWPMPFKGGFVGYFGYELKALTIGAEVHQATGPDAWFCLAREFVLYDHRLGRAYDCQLVPADYDGRLATDPAEQDDRDPDSAAGTGQTSGERASTEADAEVEVDVVAYAPGPVAPERLGLRDDHDQYLAKIERAQELILDGETYEVCLTNAATVRCLGDGISAYRQMRRISPVPYGAYLRCGDTEVLSSSPETFLRIGEDRVVESRPIKGTRPRGRSAAEDEELKRSLRASVKDRAENLMIVDLVRHDLNGVCEPGSVHVPEAFAVESYSSVHQLVSTIRGRLRWGTSAIDAVRACFPGGSMTGAPKHRTMEIIDSLEGTARGIYSGSIGWLSFSGALDLSIVIRTAVVRDGTACFGIGGAITAKSDPEEEFEEILVKASVPHFGLRGWREQR